MNKPVITIMHNDAADAENIKNILQQHGYGTGIDISLSNESAKFIDPILEIKDQSELIRILKEKADNAYRELDNFTYIASHDMQEPLRMVSSYVQLLQKRYVGKLDKDADEFIEYAVEGVKRIKAMLDDLLVYSRINIQSMHITDIDTNELFAKSIAELKRNFSKNEIKITCRNLPNIKADYKLISLMVNQLLNNAIKFNNNDSPVVDVSCERDENMYYFKVKDNGIGIDNIHKDKIFDFFQKLNNHSAFQGSGMGLAICKKIVELHQGKIWVESVPGNGSIFTFSIPH
ncbi:MAG: ATP-binding protein [Ignavibacteria bacterium]|jgi:light-regulated signal transduction histidine kinase (bacteriophytochrome)